MKHSLIKKIISVFSAVSVISGMVFGTFSVMPPQRTIGMTRPTCGRFR